MEETREGLFLDHFCIKLSYAKRFFAVVSAISVRPLKGRGSKSEALELFVSQTAVWAVPPLDWLVIKVQLLEKETN